MLFNNQFFKYLIGIILILVSSYLIKLTKIDSSLINIPLLYLLVVQFIALALGRKYAIVTSIFAFLAFDYFFIEPKYILTVSNPSEFLALCLFLTTSIIIGELTAKLKQKVQEANLKEQEATSLAKSSLSIYCEINYKHALEIIIEQIQKLNSIHSVIIILSQMFDSATLGNSSTINYTNVQSINSKILNNENLNNENYYLLDEFNNNNFIYYIPILKDSILLATIIIESNSMIANSTDNDLNLLNIFIHHAGIIMQREYLLQEETKNQSLAKAENLKTTLLQMVSHDFLSPLTSIKTSVSTLLQEVKDNNLDKMNQETKQLLLETIDNQTQRLNKLIANILEYSKFKSSEWNMNYEIVSVADIISSVIGQFDNESVKRINVSIDNDIQFINVDFIQIVQALKNLVENALKYSDIDKPIYINCCYEKDLLTFIVKDEGNGFELDESSDIYNLFYRGKMFQESNVPGMGMGLTIAKGLVEAHNGNLTAYNYENGAVFKICFPKSIVYNN